MTITLRCCICERELEVEDKLAQEPANWYHQTCLDNAMEMFNIKPAQLRQYIGGDESAV